MGLGFKASEQRLNDLHGASEQQCQRGESTKGKVTKPDLFRTLRCHLQTREGFSHCRSYVHGVGGRPVKDKT